MNTKSVNEERPLNYSFIFSRFGSNVVDSQCSSRLKQISFDSWSLAVTYAIVVQLAQCRQYYSLSIAFTSTTTCCYKIMCAVTTINSLHSTCHEHSSVNCCKQARIRWRLISELHTTTFHSTAVCDISCRWYHCFQRTWQNFHEFFNKYSILVSFYFRSVFGDALFNSYIKAIEWLTIASISR